MSMNLHCKELDLWQTPTHITYMCMSLDKKGNPDGGMEGVRKRYLYWVRSHTNGVWKVPEQYEEMKSNVKEHCEAVLKLKNPDFYSM